MAHHKQIDGGASRGRDGGRGGEEGRKWGLKSRIATDCFCFLQTAQPPHHLCARIIGMEWVGME
jgi:hypothetical protein